MERTWEKAGRRRRALAGAIALAGLLSCSAAAGASAETRTFTSTGAEQTFVVPAGVTSVHVRAVGGRGSTKNSAAEVTADLSVTPGENLYLEVGGNAMGETGGFNGGGEGGTESLGGGGGTDVRNAPRSAGLSPDTRKVVAAGSGGDGITGAAGGSAGQAGEEGRDSEAGGPGTSTAGGKGGETESCILFHERPGELIEATNGKLGQGGDGASCNSAKHGAGGGGGGGGGYYGGGGGGAFYEFECSCGGDYFDGAGGGGGSSLVPAGGTLSVTEAEPVIALTFVQPENAPAVVTGSASNTTAHASTVSATVNPEGTTVTTCEFEYGSSTFYGESAPCSSSPGSGITAVPVSAELLSLTAGTTYHYRIVATNGVGTSFGADREFTTRAHEPATVSNFSPTVGPSAGGTTVTFTGTELQYVTSVKFGGAAATNVKASPTTLTAVTPAGSGVVNVTLVNDLGEETQPGQFHYYARPVISKLSVKSGPSSGGTSLVVTGTSLEGVTEVLFGSVPGSIVSETSTTVTVQTPANTAGKLPVTAVSPGGASEPNTKAVFDYLGPTVTSVSPASGPHSGGTKVTVTGTGFALGSATVFKFGKAATTSVSCSSTTQCTMNTPAASKAGAVDVIASVGKAKSKKSPPGDRFTYE